MAQLNQQRTSESFRGLAQSVYLQAGSYARAARELGIGRSTLYDIVTGRSQRASELSVSRASEAISNMSRGQRNVTFSLVDAFENPTLPSFEEIRAASRIDRNVIQEVAQNARAERDRIIRESLENGQKPPESFS
jgi:transposase-like protein